MRFPNEPPLPAAASAAVWPVSGGTEGGEAPGAALRVPGARPPALGAMVACDPSPFSSGCIGKPPRAWETRPPGRLCTRLTSLQSSPARAVSVRSDPGPQVLPGPAYPGLSGPQSSLPCRSLRGTAPLSVLPSAGPSPALCRSPPRPGPALPATGPVPPGRWRPGDRLVEARVRARGAEGGRPVGDRGPPRSPVSRPPRPTGRPRARRRSPGARRPRKTRGDGRGGRRQEKAARPGRAGDSKEERARTWQRRQPILPFSGPKMSQPRDSRSPTLLPVRMRTHRSHFRGPAEVPPPRGPAPYPGALTHPARRLAFGAQESLASWRRCVAIG
jgi:hypothetical protein